MCRLAAFPPYFPRKKALRIIDSFYVGNTDGTGSVFLKNGQFSTTRYTFGFDKVMRKGLPFLDHMPYNGWTLAHVRAASHGKCTIENTHPFVKGPWATVHNGVFGEYAPVKAALSALSDFKGQTDTEVAAALWQVAGQEKFIKSVERSGIFMFLRNTGRLHVVCTSGDLVIKDTAYGTLMVSEFPEGLYKHTKTVLDGWFNLDKKGNITKAQWEEDEFASDIRYGWSEVVDKSYQPSWLRANRYSKEDDAYYKSAVGSHRNSDYLDGYGNDGYSDEVPL